MLRVVCLGSLCVNNSVFNVYVTKLQYYTTIIMYYNLFVC